MQLRLNDPGYTTVWRLPAESGPGGDRGRSCQLDVDLLPTLRARSSRSISGSGACFTRTPRSRSRATRASGGVGPNRTDVRKCVAGVEETRDLHDVTRVRRMDERPVPDVHPFMPWHAGGVRVEEDEVSRLELVARDAQSCVVLETGVVAELDPELPVDVHRQPRAVEPGRRLAAPDIRDAEVAIGECDSLAAQRVRRRQNVVREKRRNAGHRRLCGGKLWETENCGGAAGRRVRMRGTGQPDE